MKQYENIATLRKWSSNLSPLLKNVPAFVRMSLETNHNCCRFIKHYILQKNDYVYQFYVNINIFAKVKVKTGVNKLRYRP